MIVWVNTAIHLMQENVSKIAEECGIDRSSWYKWCKDERFIIWFEEQWRKGLRGVAWQLDVIGLKRASKDFRYWERMQRRLNGVNNSSSTITNIGGELGVKFVLDNREQNLNTS